MRSPETTPFELQLNFNIAEKAAPEIAPKAAPTTIHEDFDMDGDVWNVWPYTWFSAAHDFAGNRFHSFHKNLFKRWLERQNWTQRSERDGALKLV